jgi:hypothetical protein
MPPKNNRSGSASIVKDVEHIHSFLAAQLEVLGSLIAKETVATQCNVVKTKIELLQGLPMVIATELTRVLKTGPWSAEQVRDLADAIQASVNRDSGAAGKVKRRPNQNMRSWNSCMTMGDIEIQRDPLAHLSVKIGRNVERAVKLGIELPSEVSCGHIVSVFLTHNPLTFDAPTRHNIVLQFKQQLKRAWKSSCVCLMCFFVCSLWRLLLFTVFGWLYLSAINK